MPYARLPGLWAERLFRCGAFAARSCVEGGDIHLAGLRESDDNEEENLAQLTAKMPFLLESRLREQGAQFKSGKAFTEYVVVDGQLVTGQNPASSRAAASGLLKLLRRVGRDSR